METVVVGTELNEGTVKEGCCYNSMTINIGKTNMREFLANNTI